MLHPVLALIDMPIIIGILVVGAVLFGADKLPKLARSAGQAKKEFMMGQIEADEATAKAARRGAPADGTQSTEAPPAAPPPIRAPPRLNDETWICENGLASERRRTLPIQSEVLNPAGIRKRCRSRSTCGSSVRVY